MDWSTTATHHIINEPSTHPDTLEIQQKGRTTFWATTKRPVIGSPQLQLTTPKVDGETTVAAAKLKPSYRKCQILLGDPSHASKRDWQCVDAVDNIHSMYGVELRGKKYLWRRLKIDHDKNVKSLDHGDMEFVDAEDPDNVLAVYDRGVQTVSKHQVGRVDYIVDLGQELEVLCLISVLGLRKCQILDERTRKMPLSHGPPGFIGVVGVGGPVAAGGGGGGC